MFRLTAVFVATLQVLNAVTVKPSPCPSNKIAPHRTVESWNRGRTLSYFYNLFSDDNGLQGGSASNLQEQPQPDDPDDCGEIEDYDENDVKSVAENRHGRADKVESRWFFNWFPDADKPMKPQQPPFFPNGQPVTRPPVRPTYSPNKPQYSSGGYFQNNGYRPPPNQYPSDSVKPVHEFSNEPSIQYQPGPVGGQVGHVVGYPVRPALSGSYPIMRPPRPTNTYPQIPNRTQRPQNYDPVTARPRPRHVNNDSTVLGSFLDLFFK